MAHACNCSTQEAKAQMDLRVYSQPGLQNKYQDRDTQSLSWKKNCKNVWAEMETPPQGPGLCIWNVSVLSP